MEQDLEETAGNHDICRLFVRKLFRVESCKIKLKMCDVIFFLLELIL